MKNSIKFLVAVIAVLVVYSCNKPGHSSASYNLGVTFEVNISENPQMKDSIVTAPHYSWDQVIYFNSQASDVNVGYTGGFALSAKKGSAEDSEDQARFVSADSGAGSGKSNCYMGFLQTASMPKYDIQLELAEFYSATSSIVGCMVCNSESTKRYAEEVGFEPGDFLRVSFEFYKSDMPVGSLEKYLVDYVSGTELKMVNEWEVWDMSEKETKVNIPTFDAIKIRVETSRQQIEPCFCMDDFVVFLSVEY